MKIIVFTLIFTVMGPVAGNEFIDYNNKKIIEALEEVFTQASPEMKELSSFDSLGNMIISRGRFYKIIIDNNMDGYCYIGRVQTFGPPTSNINEYFEYLDYLAIYDTSSTIIKVAIFNYQATHGHEVCHRGWLKQFIGYGGDTELSVGKNIDAISGATKSANAITADIQKITLLLRRQAE
jgi:hypothetical protein